MHIDLAHNINIRTIHVEYTNKILSLLSQIVPSCLTHPFFYIVFDYIFKLEEVDWARIQGMFTQEQWTNVTITWNVFNRHGLRPVANEFIKARLPVLQSRGMLKFCE